MKKVRLKNKAAQELGALGGRATRKKYTSEQLSAWGKQGGRGNRKPKGQPKGRKPKKGKS
jgi:hypothetical protein